MFLDPDKLLEATPAEVLDAAARGHLGLDHRFLHALVDRPAEALPAAVAFGERDRGSDTVDLASELIALFRHFKASEGVPFLVKYVQEDPENVPDEVVVSLVENGQMALEPVLKLYQELEETENGEVAFILANLRVRDERVLHALTERLEFDFSDTLLLLGMYGDPAAKPAIERAAAPLEDTDAELKKEVADTLATLTSGEAAKDAIEPEPFDIWDLYPEKEDPPVDLLDEDERAELLAHPVAAVRSAAANSFFNRSLSPELRRQLLRLAQHDESAEVRGPHGKRLSMPPRKPKL